jgi:hypothetical protein
MIMLHQAIRDRDKVCLFYVIFNAAAAATTTVKVLEQEDFFSNVSKALCSTL